MTETNDTPETFEDSPSIAAAVEHAKQAEEQPVQPAAEPSAPEEAPPTQGTET